LPIAHNDVPKRKREILMLLAKNSLTNSEISCNLRLSPAAVSDHLKNLLEERLIEKNGRRFAITLKGLITLHSGETLKKTYSLIKRDFEFWNQHDLAAIPPHLLLRLGELGDYTIIESGENEVLKHKEVFMNMVSKSKWIRAVFGFFLPEYPAFLSKLSQEVDISIVIGRSVLPRLKEYPEEVNLFKGKLMSCGEIKLVCIACSEGLCLGLFNKKGEYDLKRGLVSYEDSAIKWGCELYGHFETQSLFAPTKPQITQLPKTAKSIN